MISQHEHLLKILPMTKESADLKGPMIQIYTTAHNETDQVPMTTT